MGEKQFKIPIGALRSIIPDRRGCFVSDHILVDGKKVGFMYREAPDFDADSGWRFFSGEEDRAYMDDPENLQVSSLNTVANYDQAIIPYLDAAIGKAFGRIAKCDEFEEEEYEPSDW